ncbi:MAG TPA: ferrochelatase [Alphaproteobacteria bacterium]|nr:ferrochelatase [Alphaproteobacteria bacterium]
MKKALVLINLGTPRSPRYLDMFCYLAQFLGDKRVVELPRWLWLPLLYGFILPFRSAKSGHTYAQIWSAETGSPLRHHTQQLTKALGQKLKGTKTVYAMRYGKPRIGSTLSQLAAQGYTHIDILPLYPQYAGATVGTTADVVNQWQSKNTHVKTRLIAPYYAHPAYIKALAQSMTAALKNQKPQAVVVSFHGIPQRTVRNGDPYQKHCEATFKALQKALPELTLILTYQSRFGREAWLQPYTDETLKTLPARAIKNVAVVAPGFAVDCVETLEELGLRARDDFLEAGGKHFTLIPCLNAGGASMLKEITGN